LSILSLDADDPGEWLDLLTYWCGVFWLFTNGMVFCYVSDWTELVVIDIETTTVHTYGFDDETGVVLRGVFFGNLGLVGGIALEIGFDLPAFGFLRF